MRFIVPLFLVLGLAACETAITDNPLVASSPPVDETLAADATAETVGLTDEVVLAAVPSNGNAAISNSQEFDTISAQETIESDAARLKALKANYRVVAPTALPVRARNSGGNVMVFALASTNAVGEQIYTRNNPLRESLNARACKKFRSADLAQEAFLQAGGPKRDSKSLDPDGDGFACDWSPVAYRAMVE